MKAAGIALVIIIALALQTSLARFLTPGGGLVDLVFVAVVYIALSSGADGRDDCRAQSPGLSQDALAASGTLSVVIGAGAVSTRSIIGIGSLAKTVVGFFAGIVGSQFIVARPLPRALVFFTATVAHAIIFVGLVSGHRPGVHAGHAGRDSQPGRRQCARRRAGVSDCRLPAELRRSAAVDGRRDADQPAAGLTRAKSESKEQKGREQRREMAEFTAPIEDRRSLTIRLVVLQVGCAVVFTILAFSFWYFQVVQNEKFKELAENNHQRTIALRAPRGVMLDRNGEVLVENRSSFTISIVREHTKDLDQDGSRAVRGRGPRSEVRARHRQPASPRADLSPDRGR